MALKRLANKKFAPRRIANRAAKKREADGVLCAQILRVLNSLAAASNVGHWRDLSEDAFLHQVTLILRARGETDVERLASALYAISKQQRQRRYVVIGMAVRSCSNESVK